MTGAIFISEDAVDAERLASFDEQLELLAGRGMCIEDECSAVQVLSCVSYYRLSGYFRYWQKGPEYGDNNSIPGTSFSRIYQLYVAERALTTACQDLGL